MDPVAAAIDAISILVLLFILLVGRNALRSFKQSRQAVTESGSLISVIVNALTSRIERSESVVKDLQSGFQRIDRQTTRLDEGHASLRSSHLQVLQYLQEILANDKRLIGELQGLKTKLTSFENKTAKRDVSSLLPQRLTTLLNTKDITLSLTPTERQTIEMLQREGPNAAPELGRRLRKSREHMARLMKKLYMEGYIDRESNRPPFRYRLNEAVRTALESAEAVTAKASERA